MHIGVVAEVTQHGMTVVSYDNTERHQDATMLMQNADIGNGAYSCTTLAVGTPCVYDIINGEVVVFGAYLPPNLNPSPPSYGYNDTSKPKPDHVKDPYVSRQQDDQPKNTQLPGDWMISGRSGSEVSLRDMLFSIKMSKAFFSTWNALNSIWDSMCNKFIFRSPGADVKVDVSESQATDTTIVVRKSAGERSGTPAIDLRLGNAANIIKLRINGQDFLHVDGERNVTLKVNRMVVEADDEVILPY